MCEANGAIYLDETKRTERKYVKTLNYGKVK